MELKKRVKNKRGISPLIAVVILITFAVILGASVVNWANKYYRDTREIAEEESMALVRCAVDVGLRVIKRTDDSEACYDYANDEITVTVENIRERKIEKIHTQVIGNISSYTLNLGENSSLDPGEAEILSWEHNISDYGAVERINLIPSIKLEDKTETDMCGDEANTIIIKTTSLGNCTS